MRWGLRISSSKQQQREPLQPPLEQDRQQAETSSKGKSKAIFSSFSPLAWLAKLTATKNAVAAATTTTNTKAGPGHATPAAAKNTTAHHQAATAFPSCFHKPTSPSPASASSSAAEAEAADTVPRLDDTTGPTVAGIAPRRRSVGNDDTRAEAANATARQQLCHRRHCSVGGDRDRDLHLPPLGHHLVSLTPKAPPVRTPLAPVLLPPLHASDTEDEEEKRTAARIISRRRRRRRVAVSSGRRSFSSSAKAPVSAVRVRSPRPSVAAGAAAVSELERLAVVRRTRDPQRAFRASMVEMIASKRMVGRPQELETLLACYLSLNADEHHDCIVKVFRQVWFELNNNNTSRAAATSAVAALPQRT